MISMLATWSARTARARISILAVACDRPGLAVRDGYQLRYEQRTFFDGATDGDSRE
jgi:hypothetical protein